MGSVRGVVLGKNEWKFGRQKKPGKNRKMQRERMKERRILGGKDERSSGVEKE